METSSGAAGGKKKRKQKSTRDRAAKKKKRRIKKEMEKQANLDKLYGTYERTELYDIMMQYNLERGIDSFGFGYASPSKIQPSPEQVTHIGTLNWTQGITDRIMRIYQRNQFVNSEYDDNDYFIVQRYNFEDLKRYCRHQSIITYYSKNKSLISQLYKKLNAFKKGGIQNDYVNRLTFFCLFGVGCMRIIAKYINKNPRRIEQKLIEHAEQLPTMFRYPRMRQGGGFGIHSEHLPDLRENTWKTDNIYSAMAFRAEYERIRLAWGYRVEGSETNYENLTDNTTLRQFQHITDFIMRFLTQGFFDEIDIITMENVVFYSEENAFNVTDEALAEYIDKCGPFFSEYTNVFTDAYEFLSKCRGSLEKCLLQVSLKWMSVVHKYTLQDKNIRSFTEDIINTGLGEIKKYMDEHGEEEFDETTIKNAIGVVVEFYAKPDSTDSTDSSSDDTSDGTSSESENEEVTIGLTEDDMFQLTNIKLRL